MFIADHGYRNRIFSIPGSKMHQIRKKPHPDIRKDFRRLQLSTMEGNCSKLKKMRTTMALKINKLSSE
jgi:hypothetical protein